MYTQDIAQKKRARVDAYNAMVKEFKLNKNKHENLLKKVYYFLLKPNPNYAYHNYTDGLETRKFLSGF